MKITEDTTLGELAVLCAKLGGPLVTIMRGPDGIGRHAIVHSSLVGSHQGTGATEAEALDQAFASLWKAQVAYEIRWRLQAGQVPS